MVASRKMPSAAQFHEFKTWLLERGRAASTASLYETNVRQCFDDERGVLARVAQDGLAPKTRRANKASLVAWARFDDDDDLLERLGQIKLPPPARVTEKRALELEDWRLLRNALAETELVEPFEHAALSLICGRGFRVMDVCRLHARDVRSGLRSGILQYAAKGNRRIGWTVTASMRPHLETFAGERGWERVWELIAPGWCAELKAVGARLRCQRAFARVVAEAGLDPDDVSLHLMRRTYAWHYLRFSGGDPVKLQKHMGWASIETAMQYVDQQQRSELDEIASELEDELDS